MRTWNASPRDAKGQRSAYEESLLGTPRRQCRTARRNPCARFIRSIRVWPVRCICMTRQASTFIRCSLNEVGYGNYSKSNSSQ
ncbi:MAG: nickel-dependent hydrogenase large subunit [Blastocatellia bacterium]